MKRQTWIAGTLTAIAAVIILVACGGGSSSGSGSAGSSASGVITGFGSVIVNGREYATQAGTQVVDGDNDDAPSSTASLQVGMTVDLNASSDGMTDSLSWLRFTSQVKGEVDAIDPTGSTLTVLGQTVQVTSGTSFAGSRTMGSTTTPITSLANISVGDYVVVYGYLECAASGCAAGTTGIVATLVSEPAAVGAYRVQGYVGNFSASSSSFTIGGLTVDFATTGAMPTLCNPAGCAFSNGDFVSVRSTAAPTGAFSPGASTLMLMASDIKRRAQVQTFAVGSSVTLEGPVNQLGATGFVVRGVTVDASASTLTSVLAGLANNQIVEVTGTISSSGTLVASAITVERAATLSLMGALDSTPTTTLSVLGQTFSVTASTRFVDWAHGMRPFNSTNFASILAAGDQVIVSGYPGSGGNVATRVERIPTPGTPTAAVQAIVSSDTASSDMLTAAGITVTLNSSTLLFYAGAGASPSLTAFFAGITPNTSVVVAVGAPGSSPGTITAADAAVLRAGVRWMN